MSTKMLLLIALVSAVQVGADAWHGRRRRGWAWALAVFSFWGAALPVYLVVRLLEHRGREQPAGVVDDVQQDAGADGAEAQA